MASFCYCNLLTGGTISCKNVFLHDLSPSNLNRCRDDFQCIYFKPGGFSWSILERVMCSNCLWSIVCSLLVPSAAVNTLEAVIQRRPHISFVYWLIFILKTLGCKHMFKVQLTGRNSCAGNDECCTRWSFLPCMGEHKELVGIGGDYTGLFLFFSLILT